MGQNNSSDKSSKVSANYVSNTSIRSTSSIASGSTAGPSYLTNQGLPRTSSNRVPPTSPSRTEFSSLTAHPSSASTTRMISTSSSNIGTSTGSTQLINRGSSNIPGSSSQGASARTAAPRRYDNSVLVALNQQQNITREPLQNIPYTVKRASSTSVASSSSDAFAFPKQEITRPESFAMSSATNTSHAVGLHNNPALRRGGRGPNNNTNQNVQRGQSRNRFRTQNTNNLGSSEHLNQTRQGNDNFNRGRGRNNNLRFNNKNPNENSSNNANHSYRPKGGFFGFKKLEELLQKNPEESLIILTNNKDALQNYLNSNQTSPDVIVLMFEVLSLIINSAFSQTVAHLLLAISSYDFFTSVQNYIMSLPLLDSAQKNRGRRFWNAPDQFFMNVALILEAIIEVLPATAMDVVPQMLKAIVYTLPNIEREHRIALNGNILSIYESLQVKMSMLQSKEEEKQRKRDEEPADDAPPPNDFREIEVYPTALEITTRSETYLRKNIIKGAYKDVYHYLDVQYRLLREDFVAPLRDGICEYFDQKHGSKQRLSNIKIYKDVQCKGVVPNTSQVGYLVQAFKPKSIKNLENTRRFMFGSLVCLTADNFNTILFGKIIDRDKKYLLEGQLVLGFDVGVELDINRSYIMVECSIYFEPYYQVLTALKQMDQNQFPFKEYLVDVKVETEPPGYLHADYVPEHHWTFNESQREAYNAALTKKFCIIQGPPGTGKTYLALRVARWLLKDKEMRKRAPMLVICYTNHALDQFLEGLLEETTSLVRVGGQCKNSKLENFNLRKLQVSKVPADYLMNQRQCKAEIEACARKLRHSGELLTLINEFHCILDFTDFCNDDLEFKGSWFAGWGSKECLNWLLYQPNNKNEVKFSDYERVNEVIKNLEKQQEEVEEEEEEIDDDPMTAQMNKQQLGLDDEFVQVDYSQIISSENYLLHVGKMYQNIVNKAQVLRMMGSQGLENTIEYLNLTRDLIKMNIDYEYVCGQLKMLKAQKHIINVYSDYHNPDEMPANDRWLLYGNWLRRHKTVVLNQYTEQDIEYRKLYNKYSEVRDMLDLYKLKNVDVIGMTTTGAARLHKTLQALKCPIVIVEEAAEVLEAHIITALSPSCQHLILIGDHKQLKPSTADYKITKDYNLGVSLFERMVENGLHCHTLKVQHRMRPEIANLVCPSIYPELVNHESVFLYPRVRGVDVPLFFISHSYPEKESADKSKENEFEAEYLIQLARYLALNNYDASRITIIAAYSGQWFLMNRLKKKFSILQKMRICILDNFQGEENDIILLSLVRNNTEGKNGFLNLENRICVALSRAKHGLYVMGNMQQLCNGSKIWREVSEVLQKYNGLGEYLTLRCENHQESFTQLRELHDFQKVSEGGCGKLCEKPLLCGHTCAKLCHSTPHDNYKCHQPCSKIICEFGHKCPDQCFMECSPCIMPKYCELPCGHSMDIPCHKSPNEINCPVMLPTKLPCGHETEKPCYADVETYKCPFPCDSRVEPCGHACRLNCHIRIDPNHEKYQCLRQCAKSNRRCCMPQDFKHACEKRCCEKCDLCHVEIRKERNCGHFYALPCSEDVNEKECNRPCKLKLSCGHNCPSKCDEPCGLCKIKVNKEIPECGHTIKWECGKVPPKKSCTNKTCPLTLACGHKCNLPCAQDCSRAKCMELVPYCQTSPCGHALKVPCHMKKITTISNELLSACEEKCNANLKCGHDCPGSCGKCAQGRFHASCTQKCSKILICGHACKMPCVENCKPCREDCEYRCEHSKCTKFCGAPCTPCNEPCNQRCVHQACKATCGKSCTISPCTEPCLKLLPCLHPCVGFCGDECPPLCRICDKDELTEIFFGNEDEEDARFVYLPECKHTLESTGLERALKLGREQDTAQEIKVIRCPKCNCPINVLRYRDSIKKAFEDVRNIKQRYFGHPRDLKDLKKALKNDINDYKHVAGKYNIHLNYFEENLKITGKAKRQDLSKADLISLRARFEIFQELIKLRKPEYTLKGIADKLVHEQLLFLFSKLFADEISINELAVEEFQAEILRFHRIMQFSKVLETQYVYNETCKEVENCRRALFAFKKYNEHQDASIKRELELLNSGEAVFDREKKMIVAALRMAPGHWFKCPNGHYYIITECGGAMQEGICPECGSKIGGTQHTLLSNNRFAPEMDNARAPAFPTVNNLDMYRFE